MTPSGAWASLPVAPQTLVLCLATGTVLTRYGLKRRGRVATRKSNDDQGLGEVMPLTPEDVSNKRFTPVRLREGYDMGEVDQFLDEVEAELDRMVAENNDLRAKLAAAQDGHAGNGAFAMPAGRSREGRGEGPGEEPRTSRPTPLRPRRPPRFPRQPPLRARRSRSSPRQRPPRQRCVCWSSRPATPTLCWPKPRKRPRSTRPHRRRALPDQGRAPRRPRPRPRPTSSRKRHATAPATSTPRPRPSAPSCSATCEREKARLDGEVENLRAFEREYRSRLKSYFTQQLQSLDSSGEGGDRPRAPTHQSGSGQSWTTRLRELSPRR